MRATELTPGRRYCCSCPVPMKGEFVRLTETGEPLFLVGPRVVIAEVGLDYQASSCKNGWKELGE